MVIRIKKPITKAKVDRTNGNKKKTLRKHFGKLKRGLNGVSYQKKVRDEWD